MISINLIIDGLSKLLNDMDYYSNMLILMHALGMILHSNMNSRQREDT